MGPTLMNNCKSEFQAKACLKRCANGYSHSDLSGKRRCCRYNNVVPISSTSRQYKNSNTAEVSSDSQDEDQNTFPKLLGKKVNALYLEDEIDLGYKMFLEHMKEDGKSYVLQMVNEQDGKPIRVKYEGDEASSDGREIPIRSKSDEEDPQNQMNSNSPSSEERSACLSKKNHKALMLELPCNGKNKMLSKKFDQSSLRSSSPHDNQKTGSLVDDSYQTFLNHVKVVRDSLVLELENGVVLKYEEEEVKTASSGKDVLSEGREMPTHRKFDVGESQDERDPNIIWSKGRTCSRKKEKLHKSRLISNGKNKSASSKSGQIILHPLSPDHNQGNEPLADESYQLFLNHVTVHGYSLMLKLDNNVVVKYEEENEVCNALKKSSAKTTLCCSGPKLESESYTTSQQHSDCVVCEDDVNSPQMLCYGYEFKFKEKLMAYLDRPFDKKEHDMLFNEAKTQRSFERRRDLRSRSISYATGRRSQSYLDCHPDLERQIRFANPHRSLTLLRGFFFWLQNLAHEGAFPPWRTLPTDHEIVPFSTDGMARPVQVELPGGAEEESDLQLIQIEMHESIKEESDIHSAQFEMLEGIKEVTDVQPFETETLEGMEEVTDVQPIEIEILEDKGGSEMQPVDLT